MSKRARNIITGLIIVLIIFVCFRSKDSKQPSDPSKPSLIQESSTYNPKVNPIPSSYSYSFSSKDKSDLNRNEIFKKSVNGYREFTYWGSDHPIQEQTRHFDNDEFDTFIKEEIQENDSKIFWGAEY